MVKVLSSPQADILTVQWAECELFLFLKLNAAYLKSQSCVEVAV